ncbi:Leucyl aminopeptidase yscIV [Chytriomyces hyalinus]|nr:Leucyl aminopeptidase yscIV [Chytriomyces hyalinus]
MSRGIPAGGVITGEDEIKTLEEAELFGGIANMVLDPNYHQPSDTVANLRGPGELILGQNVDALAHSLGFFAFHHDIDAFLAGK